MDTQKEVKRIVNWIKNEKTEAKTSGFVIGLSGGIDSSVACGLAVEAVGKLNVIGLILPYWEERKTDIEDAIRVANHYGIQYTIVPIKLIVDSLVISIEEQSTIKLEMSVMAKANVQARARMTVLRAYAELTGRLVMGTTNLSEDIIGYFTKGGDGGSGVDIEPTANYYKSEIREMGKYFKLPDDLVNRVPSAGLWETQTDEEELGMTYDDIQAFWTWKTDSNNAATECPVSEAIAKDIMKRFHNTEHKRRMPNSFKRD